MPKRHRARIIAFQILYSMAYNPVDVDEAARRYFLLEKERKKPLPNFALDLAKAVRDHQAELDARIDVHLQHWRPERLTLPDRILLRLACAEFYHFNEIPPKVTLDEYIDLAHEFSDEGAAGFVNGVLDAVLKAEPLPEGKNLNVAPSRTTEPMQTVEAGDASRDEHSKESDDSGPFVDDDFPGDERQEP